MKKLIFLFVVAISYQINAQELFVMTEPASNMAAGSVGVRLANSLMKEQENSVYDYHLIPEFMWGVSKKLMLHTSVFLSDRSNSLVAEGGSIYGKYRFLSVDDSHSHFRMAGYARYSFNNATIHQDEINLIGHNSGYQIGIVATQLIHKVAISGNLSYLNAIDNLNNNSFPDNQSNKAINYSLSFGKLMYPKKYTTFKQTNINVMLEIEGQQLIDDNKYFLDIAPSIQLIINSQARIDFAYLKQLYSNMERTAPNGVYIKFEYTFFDLKK